MLLQWFYQQNFFLVAVLLFLSFFFLSVNLCFFLSFVVPLFFWSLYWFLTFCQLVTALSIYVSWTFFSISFSVSLSFFFSFYLLLFQLFPFLLSFPIVLLDYQSNSSQSFEPLNGSAKQFSEFKCKNSPSVSNSFTLSFCEYVFHLFWEIFLSIKQYLCIHLYIFFL